MRYSKPDPGKYDLKLLWQKTILDQISRIMEAFSEGDPKTRFERIYMSVMGLDSVLKWYQDDKFKKSVGASEDNVKEMMKEMENLKKDLDQTDMMNVDFLRSKFRLDKLMELIGRSGFYPEQETGATEEDGVYENDEASDQTA